VTDANYEPKLTPTDTPFRLTDEQRDTERLLAQILGPSIADRYVDFCWLAYGKVPLRQPSPFAAHALRELNSAFFDSLESLAGVNRRSTDADSQSKDTYRDTILKITNWLNLSPDGEIAKIWLKFKDVFKKAHERKFNRSLDVDEDFRETWARPFELVVRAAALALQGKYAALMTKVEKLAEMTNTVEALATSKSKFRAHLLSSGFFTTQ
jgi:hypothetical protein